jgi:hypothetical protein
LKWQKALSVSLELSSREIGRFLMEQRPPRAHALLKDLGRLTLSLLVVAFLWVAHSQVAGAQTPVDSPQITSLIPSPIDGIKQFIAAVIYSVLLALLQGIAALLWLPSKAALNFYITVESRVLPTIATEVVPFVGVVLAQLRAATAMSIGLALALAALQMSAAPWLPSTFRLADPRRIIIWAVIFNLLGSAGSSAATNYEQLYRALEGNGSEPGMRADVGEMFVGLLLNGVNPKEVILQASGVNEADLVWTLALTALPYQEAALLKPVDGALCSSTILPYVSPRSLAARFNCLWPFPPSDQSFVVLGNMLGLLIEGLALTVVALPPAVILFLYGLIKVALSLAGALLFLFFPVALLLAFYEPFEFFATGLIRAYLGLVIQSLLIGLFTSLIFVLFYRLLDPATGGIGIFAWAIVSALIMLKLLSIAVSAMFGAISSLGQGLGAMTGFGGQFARGSFAGAVAAYDAGALVSATTMVAGAATDVATGGASRVAGMAGGLVQRGYNTLTEDRPLHNPPPPPPWFGTTYAQEEVSSADLQPLYGPVWGSGSGRWPSSGEGPLAGPLGPSPLGPGGAAQFDDPQVEIEVLPRERPVAPSPLPLPATPQMLAGRGLTSFPSPARYLLAEEASVADIEGYDEESRARLAGLRESLNDPHQRGEAQRLIEVALEMQNDGATALNSEGDLQESFVRDLLGGQPEAARAFTILDDPIGVLQAGLAPPPTSTPPHSLPGFAEAPMPTSLTSIGNALDQSSPPEDFALGSQGAVSGTPIDGAFTTVAGTSSVQPSFTSLSPEQPLGSGVRSSPGGAELRDAISPSEEDDEQPATPTASTLPQVDTASAGHAPALQPATGGEQQFQGRAAARGGSSFGEPASPWSGDSQRPEDPATQALRRFGMTPEEIQPYDASQRSMMAELAQCLQQPDGQRQARAMLSDVPEVEHLSPTDLLRHLTARAMARVPATVTPEEVLV